MAIAMTDFTRNTSIDNNYNVTGDGIFDDMMEAVNSNIKAQYDAGRITGSDYASVYLGAMQTAISQSVQVMLNKALVDAQVANEEAKTDLINVQIQEEQYKLDTLLPDEHADNLKDLEVKSSQIQAVEKDMELKDKQIQEEQYKLDTLLPDEHKLNIKKEEQLDDELLTTTKQRDLISKDIELKNVQLDEEQYKLDVLLPDEHTDNLKDLESKDAQIDKVNSDKALIDAQEAEIHLNAESNRAVKAKDLEVKDAQKELYIRQKQSLNDSLLKDLYKEASGGTAMVYSELDGAIATPNSWSQVDKIANQILTSAGSTYQFTVANS